MMTPGFKMALPKGSWVWTIELYRKIFKNFLLQKHLAQMLEIWHVALPCSPLLSLLKWWPHGPKWPSGRDSLVWTIEIHRKIFKNLLLRNHLAQMLELIYDALPGGLLQSLCKCWPWNPNSPGAGSPWVLLSADAWNLVWCLVVFLPRLFKWWRQGQKWPAPGVLGLNHRIHRKIFKNLFQNHLAQILEI